MCVPCIVPEQEFFLNTMVACGLFFFSSFSYFTIELYDQVIQGCTVLFVLAGPHLSYLESEWKEEKKDKSCCC